MASLQDLVKEHGYGITVKAPKCPPFKILRESSPTEFDVEYSVEDYSHKYLRVLKECEGCNDYNILTPSYR